MGHLKIASCLFLVGYVLCHVPFCPIYAPGGASLRQAQDKFSWQFAVGSFAIAEYTVDSFAPSS